MLKLQMRKYRYNTAIIDNTSVQYLYLATCNLDTMRSLVWANNNNMSTDKQPLEVNVH